ncbi:gag/pol/env polyprotein, putative [Perkinsus marinus ATCC 50983]|uniref:Gag/pol/env polyprotein, putative n=1 Tax=Perkinsus marinus (strain ATCC 50983 / TXsc) TaxID=423536 RepID=C5KWX8_PERM5|nr:gag/pol/env polyprotein, putative [Perkinsus marinus ATCC 50983]EER10982.1 gag/pol/env polyprotein, putative [Perkinsus marinus ATCC 50983]|eukprot:XP_002779187.1 gag/pol/env polyprotein, putative [Perkinsus marinus ATCC 50983]
MGHVGRVRTRNIISRRFFWRKIGATVSRTLRTCTTCMPLRNQRRYQPTGGSKKITELDVWQYCAVDGLGPLKISDHCQNDDDGSNPNKRLATVRLIVISDLVSGFCDAEYVHSFDKNDTCHSVSSILWRRGWPVYLLADNHKGFTNRQFRKTILQHGTRLLFSGLNNPAMNGATERVHAVLTYTLKCLLRGLKPTLSAFNLILQKALLLVNARRRLDACCSPFYLLHCREPRVPGLPDPEHGDAGKAVVSCTNADAVDNQPVEVTNAARRQLLRQSRLREVIEAYEKNRESRRLRGRGSPLSSTSSFNPGDKVYVFTRKSSKMSDNYRGPYIVQVATAHTLVVKTPNGFEVHSTNNCKLCSTVDEQRSSFTPLFTDIADNDVEGFMKKVILMRRDEVHSPQALSDDARITPPALTTSTTTTPSPPVTVSPTASDGRRPVTRSQTGAIPKKIMMRTAFAP